MGAVLDPPLPALLPAPRPTRRRGSGAPDPARMALWGALTGWMLGAGAGLLARMGSRALDLPPDPGISLFAGPGFGLVAAASLHLAMVAARAGRIVVAQDDVSRVFPLRRRAEVMRRAVGYLGLLAIVSGLAGAALASAYPESLAGLEPAGLPLRLSLHRGAVGLAVLAALAATTALGLAEAAFRLTSKEGAAGHSAALVLGALAGLALALSGS